MKRKGQVTIFVIIGLFLLIIAAVLIYFREDLTRGVFQRESQFGVSEQFKPVRDFYENCVREVALEGLNLVGGQGGYLNIPEDNLAKDLYTGFDSSLSIFGDNLIRIPYWYYKTSNNLDRVQVPSLEDIELNVENYISDNVLRCFVNDTLFSEYDIEGYGALNTEVEIQEDKVFVNIQSPIDVSFKGVTETIQELSISLDVPLGKLYNVAKSIFEKEQEEFFLEERTIDYMALYDEIPLSGANLDCNVKIWNREIIIDDFKEILNLNLQSLKLIDGEAKDKYSVIDLNSRGADVVFNYNPEWPFVLDVAPEDNGLLASDQIVKDLGVTRFLFNLFCLQNYHFIYDVRYPVMVSLSENNYNFQFATQVVIDNNNARNNPYNPVEFNEDSRLCENKVGLINVDVSEVSDSGVLISSDSDISFKCFNTVCDLGESKNSVFRGSVPQCVNGLLQASKNGYYDSGQIISTNVPISTQVILEPVYNKQLEIKLINDNGIIDITKEFVTLQFIGKNGYNEIINYPDTRTVNLVTGPYDVKAYVFSENSDGFVIGGNTVNRCIKVPRAGVLGLFLTKEECVDVDIEEQEVNQVVIGGNEFEFDVLREEIVNNNKLVIYLIANEIPRTYDEMNNVYDSIPVNHLDTRFREPEFTA